MRLAITQSQRGRRRAARAMVAAPPLVRVPAKQDGEPHEPRPVAASDPGYRFGSVRVDAGASPRVLSLSRPHDPEEERADRVAEEASRRDPAWGRRAPEGASDLAADAAGAPLPVPVRDEFEARLGHHLGRVRIHTDAVAADAARSIGASAFALGSHVVFGRGQYAPDTPSGRELLAHELAHAIEAPGGDEALPRVHRRLIATGSAADIADFISLAEPAMGVVLHHDPATNEIQIIGTSATPATSPAFERILTRIINDPSQDAEVNFGTQQAGVSVGAFPQPADLTVTGVQRIDMDDVLAIEAGAPGSGVAKLAHEIEENYTAHAAVPAAGVSLFPAAHRAGVAAESDVAEELVGPGRRIAERLAPAGTNILTVVQDFTTYFLVFTLTRDPATNDFSVSNAQQAPRLSVSQHVIDNFGFADDALPPGAAPTIAAVNADLTANPTATVHIEGFTDGVGGASPGNVALSERRAASARTAIVAGGVVGPASIATFGRGATGFVAPNVTEADRARNRRVVITIEAPAP